MARQSAASPAQTRRRSRRAAERESIVPAIVHNAEELEALLAAGATAKKDYPLSARDAKWDAGAANKRWQEECGIGGDSPDWAKFRSGYLYFDPENQEAVGGGKLPYVDVIGGKPTAVWGAITAAAGGHGVDATKGIPAEEKDSIKKVISSWYGVARKQYDDDTIEAPWDAKSGENAADPDRFAALRERASLSAAADLPWDSEDGLMDVMSDLSALLNPGDSWGWGVVDVAIGGASAILCDWEEGEYWLVDVTYGDDKEPVLGPSSDWTPVESEWVQAENAAAWDRHVLETNRRNAALSLGEFAAKPACANCDDAYADHLGTDGPCTADECDCTGYVAPENEEAAAKPSKLATAYVRIRPQMEGFREELAAEITEAFRAGFQIVFDELRADGATNVPLPDEHQPGEKMPKRRPSPRAPEPPAVSDDAAVSSSGLTWTATLCPEAAPTSDGRIFAPDAIDWRDLPLTLMAMTATSAEGGHDGAQVAGRIDRIWREGSLIRASGDFDSGEYGAEIARLVGDGTLRGISVDLAISEMEIAYASEVLDADGNWILNRDDASEAEPVWLGGDEDVMLVVWKATIGMATVCPFQAFAEATIGLTDALTAAGEPNPNPDPFLWTYVGQAGYVVVQHEVDGLVASAATLDADTATAEDEEQLADAPELPPADWFADPELDELTALTVDDDGRIYGHAAAWDVCHTGFPDVCVVAPHSRTGYAFFHLKEVLCDDGSRIACGTITFDTGHAGQRLTRAAATRHYDDTGTAAADITVGEDEHGIWVAGAMRPGATEETYRKIRGAVLSGDWRDVQGNLELVALLAVNVPGFPVPRVKANIVASANGGAHVVSLTAAGIPDDDVEGHGEELSAAVREQFKALGDRASGRYAELAARARGED